MEKIGDNKSQYYNACYQIARVMLCPESEKRRCVILHGDTDTGKSRIADYMRTIFESYYKHETRGIHDEKIKPIEAHKQLYIHDEACLDKLCHKGQPLASFKLLTEGKGRVFENKYGHPFPGAVGSYQLITC